MYELTIPAMTCGHCQKTITGALLALDGNATLGFDLGAHKLMLDTAADIDEVKSTLDGAGYPAEVVAANDADGGHHCDMCD